MSTLVVTDLDGTLWDTSERCHPKTLAAIKELKYRDIPLLVATGRRERGARLGFDLNGLALPAVLVNGSTAFDFQTQEELFVDHFAPNFLVDVLPRLEEAGLSPALLTSPDGVVVGENPKLHSRYVEALGDGFRTETDLPSGVVSAATSVVGLVIMAMTETELGEARSVFASFGHVDYSFHLDHFYPGWMLMAQPKGVNKWTGIQRYVDLFPEQIDNIVVIGDSTNDIPMFEGADLSIWVEGGHERVKAVSDMTISSPTVGGWADIVDIVAS